MHKKYFWILLSCFMLINISLPLLAQNKKTAVSSLKHKKDILPEKVHKAIQDRIKKGIYLSVMIGSIDKKRPPLLCLWKKISFC